MNLSRRAALAAPAILAAGTARAQSPAIRLVVGFPAGGGVDAIARPVAARWQERLGQPVVIDNRPGNNGNIAMDFVAKGVADGTQLFQGNVGNLAMTHALFPSLPFDTSRDFRGVGQLTLGPLVFAVNADSPIRSMEELVAAARARPGALNFGSGGSGGVPHLAFEVWKRAADVDIVHVPYRGSAPALQDLLGGRIQMMLDGYSLMRGAHEGGRLRVIGITSSERHPQLATVPTVKEGGLDWVFESWQAIVCPAATPAAVRQRLEDRLAETFAQSDLPATLTGLGTFPRFAPGAAVDRLIREDRARWTSVVREANITAD
ncbi:MAG: tripartite tricarboxylate transporter substrate binding protein [Acetobacteraceae bacterium]|nr:tripartite tricarboxylate transporter substrate binding protein [Acetobacteraceae bacterium]